MVTFITDKLQKQKLSDPHQFAPLAVKVSSKPLSLPSAVTFFYQVILNRVCIMLDSQSFVVVVETNPAQPDDVRNESFVAWLYSKTANTCCCRSNPHRCVQHSSPSPPPTSPFLPSCQALDLWHNQHNIVINLNSTFVLLMLSEKCKFYSLKLCNLPAALTLFGLA